MTKHSWTKEETQIALKAYLDGLSFNEAKCLANKHGINPNSFFMRMANFKSLDTNGKCGLSKIKKLEQEVWDEYRKI